MFSLIKLIFLLFIAIPPVLADTSVMNSSAIESNIKFLYTAANKDEYRLSIVLLASAQQGDRELYHKVLPEMQTALNHLPKSSQSNTYKAWLLGRVLLASTSMNDKKTTRVIKRRLEQLLHNNVTPKDAFAAWGWGYLAGSDKEEHEKIKNTLLSAALAIRKKPDALWAWVLILQSSAQAQDKLTYVYAINQIKSATGQNSISKGLSSIDYPAWALAITYLAAVKMEDHKLREELEKPVLVFIYAAQKTAKLKDEKIAYGATAEATLAQLSLTQAKLILAKRGNNSALHGNRIEPGNVH